MPPQAAPAGVAADIPVSHPAGFLKHIVRRHASAEGVLLQNKNRLLKKRGSGALTTMTCLDTPFTNRDTSFPVFFQYGRFLEYLFRRPERIAAHIRRLPPYTIARNGGEGMTQKRRLAWALALLFVVNIAVISLAQQAEAATYRQAPAVSRCGPSRPS